MFLTPSRRSRVGSPTSGVIMHISTKTNSVGALQHEMEPDMSQLTGLSQNRKPTSALAAGAPAASTDEGSAIGRRFRQFAVLLAMGVVAMLWSQSGASGCGLRGGASRPPRRGWPAKRVREPSPATSGTSRQWSEFVGQPAPLVPAVAYAVRHQLDGTNQLPLLAGGGGGRIQTAAARIRGHSRVRNQ